MKIFKKSNDKFISQVVILSMIFGFTAGVVGQIVADTYIEPWKDDYVNQPLFDNQNTSISIPELKPQKRFLGIEQDFEVNKAISKVAPSLVGIYTKKTKTNQVLGQVFLDNDLEANAFILTSDGWLVSHGVVFNETSAKNLIAVFENKILDIEEIIKDDATGVVFIKISANNLPVVVLGDSAEANLGQLVLAYNVFGEATVSNIEDTNYLSIKSANDLIMSSEKYDKSILLSDELANLYLGAPLVNLAGEVVGVVKENDTSSNKTTVIPINQFRSIVLDVLRNNLIKRTLFGAQYIDLSLVSGLDKEITNGYTKGALVYQAPLKNTPAFEIGLQKNDIIISVDSQPVDQNSDLTELIQEYEPGDEVSFEIVRDGEVITKKVTLSILMD